VPATLPQHRQFEELVDQYGGIVKAFLIRLCRNRHDAEDAFQETAVRVWRHLARGEVVLHPKSWLMTVAYRTFIDLKARRRTPPEPLCEQVDIGDGPDAIVSFREDALRMVAAVDGLTDTIRDVVLLHYTGGLSLRETADTLGISEGTAKSRLNAALVQLRKRLS
jgi:RNA polymerase sigma-70 factor (ECF subfamily)